MSPLYLAICRIHASDRVAGKKRMVLKSAYPVVLPHSNLKINFRQARNRQMSIFCVFVLIYALNNILFMAISRNCHYALMELASENLLKAEWSACVRDVQCTFFNTLFGRRVY